MTASAIRHGDGLLRTRPRSALRTGLGEDDFVARIGGDEFAIGAARDVSGPHDASGDTATRLIDALGAPYMIDGVELVISAQRRHRAGAGTTATTPTNCCATPTWRSTAQGRRPRH